MSRIVTLALAFVLMFSSSALAAGKIGVAHLDQVTAQSEMGKESQKVLQAQFGNEKTKLDKDIAAFQKSADEFQKQAAALSENARMSKAQELDKTMRDLDGRQQAYTKKVGPVAQKIDEQVIATLNEALANFAKANDFDLIVNAQAVLFASQAINVSEDLLTEVNKVWKSKGGKFKLSGK